MKGKFEIIVRDMHLQYKFIISRNITILRGDSATGKTTLIDMIAAYQLNGVSSGVSIKSDKKCVVLTGINWQVNLKQIDDSIVFIDEGDAFVRTKEFATEIQKTSNYYVIATRTPLHDLPYSVSEVYGIKNTAGNRYQGTKRLYSQFYRIYESEIESITQPELAIVEDSNAGYEFFCAICRDSGIKCISANGKSNIYEKVKKCKERTILVIADGAAFGSEMEKVLSLKYVKTIVLYLPESFEWIILSSGLIDGKRIAGIIDSPEEYIESQVYFSWEQFFTRLLIDETKDNYLRYNKSRLNEVYLRSKEKSAIINKMDIVGEMITKH